MNVFVTEDLVPNVGEALCRIFAENGPRESRGRARMKFMVNEWNAPRLREMLCKVLGYELEPEVKISLREDFFRDPISVGSQKQGNLHHLTLATTAGRLSPEDLHVAAGAADDFGSGNICLTTLQNMVVVDIPDVKIEEASDRLYLAPTAHLNASLVRTGTVACTGLEYCEKAQVETKELAASCIDYLENEGVNPVVPLKIAFSGCSNDCGQAQAADIGLIGTLVKDVDSTINFFSFMAGTKIGDKPEKGIRSQTPILAEKVAARIAYLIRRFNEHHQPGESFTDFYRRRFTEESIEFQI